jgi:hypothetical protein
MDEFESTITGTPPIARLSVVYDPRDGRIVYTHEIIGRGRDTAAAKAEREKAALASAARHRPDVPAVRVLHLPDGFRKEPEKRYRVDAKAGTLVAQAMVAGRDRKSSAGAAAASTFAPRASADKSRSRPTSAGRRPAKPRSR